MYTFKFRGVYTNNRAFNKQISAETGNVICDGKTSTAQEFCVDKNFLDSGIKIYRSFCNENNKVRMLSGGNCTFERPGSVCSGPDKTGKTFCAIASSCYLPNMTNPFGLFFNKESCLFSNKADNLKNYCYFDYSNTIVDKCYSCTSIDSCYDYQSQKACEENSCQFANGNCAWMPSQYGVFGKGYCYQKNYTKTDKCSLCGPDSGLFKNTKCSQEVCSILGSCFSETKSKNKINLNFTQCSSCSPDTSCRQFKTKDLCIGIGNTLTKPSFNVPAGTSAEDTALLKALYDSCSSTPDIIKKYPLSKDSCSLGGCNWKPGAFGADSSLNTGDYCFKDVNFDGNPDCSDSTGTCNRDNIAPDTFVSFPAVINKNNRAITFTIIDKGSDSLGTETFVCFGNYCCPNNLVSVDSANPFGNIKKLTIADENGSLFQEARQGHNIMGFYSKDSRGNIESVQYKQIYIDTQPPVITITPDVRNSTISDLSDVDVRVSLDEFARCTARMEPVGTTFYTIKNPISNESGTELTASFTNVKDFTYAFIILCTDANGNTNKISQGLKNVVVDRNRKILSSSPQNKKLTNGNVLVKLNVTDRATCTLTNLDDNGLVTLQETGTPKIVGPFIYTFQFTNLANRTYRYNANCIDFNNKFLDSAAVFFTVDDQAPTTSVKLSKGGVLENFDQNNPFPYQVADLSLLCGDPNITGIPGQFNCNSTSTRWCFSTSITSCDPTNKFTRPLKLADLSSGSSAGSAGTGRICFFSSDLGGNIEQRKCVGIQRDIFPPEITNISMIGKRTQQVNLTNFRTVDNKINVTGIINEKAVVFVSIFADNKVKTVLANTTIVSTGTGPTATAKTIFNANLSLSLQSRESFKTFPIVVRAFDFGSNMREKELILEFDNIGPRITATVPNPFSSNNDKPLIKVNTSKAARCELFHNIEGLSSSIQERRIMATQNNITHTVQIERSLPYAEGLSKSSIIKFNCTDLLNEKTSVSNKQFIVDKDVPEIMSFEALMQGVMVNSTGNSKDYLMLQGLLTSFRVNASEPVRCRFSETKIKFEEMEHNFMKFNNFSKGVESEIVTNLNDKENATFFISCKDAAGNNASLKTINVEVRLNAPIIILDPQPKRFVNTLKPLAKAKTAFNVDCFASSQSTGLLFIFDSIKQLFGSNPGIKMQKDKINNQFIHAAELSSLSGNSRGFFEEGKNFSLSIKCEDPRRLFSSSQVDLEFTPDITIPVINNFIPDKNFITARSLLNLTGTTEKFSTVTVFINGLLVRKPIFLNNTQSFLTTIALKNGINNIRVVSTDRAGNEFSILRVVNFTNKGPVVVKINPNSGTYSKLDNITAQLLDLGKGIDVIKTEIIVLNQAGQQVNGIQKIFLKNDTVVVAKLPDLESGQYTAILRTFSNDLNLTEGESAIIEFTIVKDAPIIRIIKPDDGIKTNKQAPTFEVEIQTKVANILRSIDLNLNGENFVIKRNNKDVSRRTYQDLNTGKEVYTLTDQNIQVGKNNYTISATDELSRTAITETRTIELDINALLAEIEVQQPPEAEKLLEHKCEIASGIVCQDVDTKTKTIILRLKNQLGFDLRRGTIVGVCGTDTELKVPVAIGQTINMTITCSKDVTFETESKLAISFRQGSGPAEEVQGRIVAKVKKPFIE